VINIWFFALSICMQLRTIYIVTGLSVFALFMPQVRAPDLVLG
jgi:hypothetical protein